MKLRINYDFFNAIKDVNEGFTPMKIVRNNKKVIAYYSFPIWFITDYIITKNISETLKILLFQFMGLYMGGVYGLRLISKEDFYKEKAKYRLRLLVHLLKDINVNTTYKLLTESELEEKKYKVHLNELKIPELIEHKYVLVPCYDFNGVVKDISIDQEHIVGTNDYILSVGSPEKELKLVYSNI